MPAAVANPAAVFVCDQLNIAPETFVTKSIGLMTVPGHTSMSIGLVIVGVGFTTIFMV